nr:response regulator [Lachnospiraceae bacterium]
MKLRILIVDDEPLVQIGLKSMLAGDFPDVEIVGSAGNGRDALKLIGELRPDIVISDIKMPVMGGLELMEEAGRRFGGLPVFILLTAYEDFELARRAVAGNAADYLVKIELSAQTLRDSIKRAGKRVAEQVSFQDKAFDKTPGEASLEEFRQKFMLAHLNHLYTDREIFLQKARENNMDFSYNRYILVYGELGQPVRENNEENRQWNLYTSCLNMVREIVARYAPCYTVSIDIRHFALIFYFKEAEAVAGA